VSIVSFWEGGLRGLGIIGAVIGGAIGVLLYIWEHNHGFLRRAARKLGKPRRRSSTAGDRVEPAVPDRMSYLSWLDIAAIGLPLGQAIGRWGNYFNQELYGRPTTLPWGLTVDAAYRLPQYAAEPDTTRFHPTFLYESVWCLAVFAVLLVVAVRLSERTLPGDIALLYLVLYPLGRSVIELQRPDAWMAGGLPVAQVVSLVVMAAASLAILWRHDVLRRRAPAATPAKPAASA
jgi:prolipoprotein diacylglyceryl transferase